MQKLGTFTALSGSLLITDPARPHSAVDGIAQSVRGGAWQAFASFTPLDPWGELCRFLLAIHDDYQEQTDWLNTAWTKFPFIVKVNSGQAGIFDSGHYQDGVRHESAASAAQSDWFYTCEDLTAEREAGVLTGGAVSLSGTGNGHYGAYFARNDQAQIVAVKIVYIKPPED